MCPRAFVDDIGRVSIKNESLEGAHRQQTGQRTSASWYCSSYTVHTGRISPLRFKDAIGNHISLFPKLAAKETKYSCSFA